MNQTKKICTFCSSALPMNANFCSKCQHYTDNRKNVLRSVLSGGGIATIIIAGIPFGINSGYDLYKKINKFTDVNIVSLHTGPYPEVSYSLVNSGSSDIFLKDISVFYGLDKSKGNSTYEISKILKAGDFLTFLNLKPDNEISDKFLFMNTGMKKINTDYVYKNSFQDKISDPKKVPCFIRVIFDNKNTHIRRMDDFLYPRAKTIVTKEMAEISYIGTDGNLKRKSFQVYSAFKILQNESCYSIALKK